MYIYMCITVSFYYTTISLLALGSYEEAHFWWRWTVEGSKRYISIRGDRTHSITFFLSFFPLFSAAVVFRCCCFAKGSVHIRPSSTCTTITDRIPVYLYLLEMITSLSTNSVNVIETFRL